MTNSINSASPYAPAAVVLLSSFTVDATGVRFRGPEGGDGVLITSTPIYVEAETRDDRSESWGRLLTWSDREGHGHSWMMPLALLAGESTHVISKLMDEGVIISPVRGARDLFLQYLQEPAQKRIRCCTQIGWYGDSFVLADETVSPPGSEDIRFQTSSMSRYKALTTKGKLDAWRETVGAWCTGNSRLILTVSMGFAGPMLKLAGEPGGGIHLFGTTSDGKSTAENACV